MDNRTSDGQPKRTAQSETTMNDQDKIDGRIAFSLLTLRIGVAIVFMMWTLDKLLNPEHAAGIFERYYLTPGLGASLMIGVGIVQMVLVLSFLSGFFRTWTYGLITILHTVSTISCYKQYMNPWEKPNLLFFAAFPMLAACISLWLLRELDTWTVDSWWGSKKGMVATENEPQPIN